ncbi:MAG: 30S ribosomal protein S4 [Treponema sp. GWB1_62_6]|nr:MAG: 30S ribosomal protein S4 [Treponema sp. GWA1_62_8]OHE69607.1 MAG: 30S ribosomal protein S4 [Treponema sp. GWC1_61_84]OHE71292.1 MAG: 30S ribosomal protein S4 [Treponema sp. GWB1_62_6]OHE71520.1 MAG: 30S ribosomal protein S4 [Treponema sp. RIFOXYC1_FULL_61_9]HCM25060.1 30S ribosomal protein S4 [Treponema sp.]
MARYTGPVCRLCRTEQKKLFLKGDRCRSDKCPINKKRPTPGKDPKARLGKRSDYGHQLREKQKLKRIYGMQEKQFVLFFERALRMPGITGENLFVLLERRLDNVAYRLRFSTSRSQARQFVLHGHVTVNGQVVNVPSFLVKPNDVIEIKDSSKGFVLIKEALKEFGKAGVMPWLQLDPDAMKGTFLANPRRSDVTDLADIKEQMVVELYSK